MGAIKQYIGELKISKKSFTRIISSNAMFLAKPYVIPLRKMNFRTEGKLKPSGVLEAAQNDHRLHKTDGHFFLEAYTVEFLNKGYKTIWSVDSVYDFEPFEKKNYYTEIPLGENKLIIYDGLSEYMTRIGVAKVFSYRAEWAEVWK